MNAQKGLDMHRENADTTPWSMARWQKPQASTARRLRQSGPQRPALAIVVICGCVLTTVGCKTGTSFAKPSWWTLGGGGKADVGTLAAAPPYEGDIKKPSETAKPYPTTSTPNGYVITGSSGAAGLASQTQSPQPTAPVVYGSAPPSLPPASTAALPPAPSGSAGPAPGGSALGPQVGPYASLAGDTIPPPGQPLPPIGPSSMPATPAVVPAEAPLPGMAGSAFPAATPPSQASAFDPAAARMADARFAPAAAPAAVSPVAIAPQVPAPAANDPAVAAGGRYGSSSGSRFAGPQEAGLSGTAVGPSAYPASYGRPDELPASNPTAPFSTPTPAASPAAPSAAPGLLQPSGQPVRRPDSGYRPGGTSSYRPSRSLLADDSAPAAVAVRTAAFEEPAAARQ